MTKDLIWKGGLALVGCLVAAYVGDEVLHGELIGWVLGGLILGATCAPLFKTLIDRRKV